MLAPKKHKLNLSVIKEEEEPVLDDFQEAKKTLL